MLRKRKNVSQSVLRTTHNIDAVYLECVHDLDDAIVIIEHWIYRSHLEFHVFYEGEFTQLEEFDI